MGATRRAAARCDVGPNMRAGKDGRSAPRRLCPSARHLARTRGRRHVAPFEGGHGGEVEAGGSKNERDARQEMCDRQAEEIADLRRRAEADGEFERLRDACRQHDAEIQQWQERFAKMQELETSGGHQLRVPRRGLARVAGRSCVVVATSSGPCAVHLSPPFRLRSLADVRLSPVVIVDARLLDTEFVPLATLWPSSETHAFPSALTPCSGKTRPKSDVCKPLQSLPGIALTELGL